MLVPLSNTHLISAGRVCYAGEKHVEGHVSGALLHKRDASSCGALLDGGTPGAQEGAGCCSSCLASNPNSSHASRCSCLTLKPLVRQRHHRCAGAALI